MVHYTQKKERKGEFQLDYVIKNSRNIYIKLDGNGTAVTCCEAQKGLFNEVKAKNIIASLPKRLQKMSFYTEAILDIPQKTPLQKVIDGGKTTTTSVEILAWVDKFGKCSDILNEAKDRSKTLIDSLHQVDDKIMDLLHIIELENSKDMYHGWLIYKEIKANREKRRRIKDELLIIDNVLRDIKPECVQRERIQKAIDGLFARKYTYRIVEEGDENAAM